MYQTRSSTTAPPVLASCSNACRAILLQLTLTLLRKQTSMTSFLKHLVNLFMVVGILVIAVVSVDRKRRLLTLTTPCFSYCEPSVCVNIPFVSGGYYVRPNMLSSRIFVVVRYVPFIQYSVCSETRIQFGSRQPDEAGSLIPIILIMILTRTLFLQILFISTIHSTMDGELEESAHGRNLQVPLLFGQLLFLFFPLLQPPPSPPLGP